MATAKKSAKSKKPATAKKSLSTATKSKKTVSKKVTKTTVKKSESKKVNLKKLSNKITLEKIYKFNLIAAVVNIGFAILSVVLLSEKTVSLTYAYATKDELASTNETVLGQAYGIFVNFEIRYILAAIFAVSAIFCLLMATALRKKYEAAVKSKVSTYRWLFVGVSSGLLLHLATIVGGVTDIVTLKMVLALIFVTSVLGWASEYQNRSNEKNYGLFYLSILTGVLAWVPLVVSLIATTVKGMEYFDWYVYTLAAVLFVGFSSFAVSNYRNIKKAANEQKYLSIEGQFLSTLLLLNLATYIIFLFAIK